MDLFDQINDGPRNLLPYDGTVLYYGRILPPAQATDYYQQLFDQVPWQHDEAIIYGKKTITKRKVAWYGDAPFSYTYSKVTKTARPWLPVLQELKTCVEQESNEAYNSCLLNLYHNGSEGMAWHSDGEKDLKRHGAIALFTFGAERKFSFKHKQTKETVSLFLEAGSLLIMKDTTQTHWLHRLPPTTQVTTPRISLTFRTIEKAPK